MGMRTLFLVSLVLAVLAISSHGLALGQFSRGALTLARAVTLPEAKRATARPEADRYTQRGGAFLLAGYALALLSVGFVVASARKHEPARRSLTIGLLTCYALLQLLVV